MREGWRDGWADKQLQFPSTALCNSLPTQNRADLCRHVQILGNTSCVPADKEMWHICARAQTRAQTHAHAVGKMTEDESSQRK